MGILAVEGAARVPLYLLPAIRRTRRAPNAPALRNVTNGVLSVASAALSKQLISRSLIWWQLRYTIKYEVK